MGLGFHQWRVVNDPGFRGVVETATMYVAYGVLQEANNVPQTQQRKKVAREIFRGYGSTLERYIRLFSWYAVFNPQVQGQVFDTSTQTIHPERVEDELIIGIIRDFWSAASGLDIE